MRKVRAYTPEIRLNQVIRKSPFNMPQVLSIRQKIMKHYIPKTELIKLVRRNRGAKRNPEVGSLQVDIVPREVCSLSPSPHKINLDFDSSLSFDLNKNPKAKRFKPHLTYFKLTQKPCTAPISQTSPQGKFKLIIKGLQCYYSSGTTLLAGQHLQGFTTFILTKVLPT